MSVAQSSDRRGQVFASPVTGERAKGVPRPLQLAVSARGYRDVMEVASPPPPVQALLFGPLAAPGRARRPGLSIKKPPPAS